MKTVLFFYIFLILVIARVELKFLSRSRTKLKAISQNENENIAEKKNITQNKNETANETEYEDEYETEEESQSNITTKENKNNTPLSNISIIGVFELVRHGARTPIDKGNTHNFYLGTMRSQLTINGLRQHLLLGRWIRDRYINDSANSLFGKDFSEKSLKVVEVLSSHRQRSIFSAASHLLGMFPNAIIKLNHEGHVEIKNNDVPPIKGFEQDFRDGREVIINVLNGRKDRTFKASLCSVPGSNLSLIKELRANKKDLFEISEEQKRKTIDEILRLYADVVGVDGIDLEKEKYSDKTFKHILSFLRPFKYHYRGNLTLSPETMQTISKAILNKFWNVRLEETVQKKLLSSSILDTLFNFFQKKANNTTEKLFYLLSGFDNSIADVISNIFDSKFLENEVYSAVNNTEKFSFLVPPVSSSLIFELVRDNETNRKYVRILYNGKVIYRVFRKPLKITRNQFIDFSDFMSLLQERIDKNYDNLHCDIDD